MKRKVRSVLLKPQEGPQTEFCKSWAEEVLYGGAAGGGKTFAVIMEAARYVHVPTYRALILRRTVPELYMADGPIDIAESMFGGWGTFNRERLRWTFPSGARVEFGHMEREKDKERYQTGAWSYIAFDQVEQFTEKQYLYMYSRLRSGSRDPRTGKPVPKRLRATANPPDSDQPGITWLMPRFAPWLDPSYPAPAEPGEVRWFARDLDGREVEVLPGTEGAVSRTFIRALVWDNKILLERDPGYVDRLRLLPEPYRSMLLKGEWLAGRAEERLVIPLKWVQAAQARWQRFEVAPGELTAVGVDVGGGRNLTVIARRFGWWIDELERMNVPAERSGKIADRVAAVSDEKAVKVIDVIGIGASVVSKLREMGVPRVVAFNASSGSSRLDSTGQLSFRNLRAEAWWRARELLSPDSPVKVALPPDPELLADLTTPTWKMTTSGIQIQDKDEIKRKLGRSPDAGDAVVMALWVGNYQPPEIRVGESEYMEEWRRKFKSSWR